MKRIASREPNLDIFGQKLIDREVGCWAITEQGQKVLEQLEQLDRSVAPGQSKPGADNLPPMTDPRHR